MRRADGNDCGLYIALTKGGREAGFPRDQLVMHDVRTYTNSQHPYSSLTARLPLLPPPLISLVEVHSNTGKKKKNNPDLQERLRLKEPSIHEVPMTNSLTRGGS